MPHSSSAKKRLRQSEKQRIRNKSKKSAMKSMVKRVLAAVDAKEAQKAKSLLPEAMALIDKAAKCNAIHTNTASRRKSRLARAIQEIETR